MRNYSEGPGWSAMISWLLAFVLLFVGFMAGDVRGDSGIIDPALVSTVIFIVVCGPIFLLAVTAGIIAIAQGKPWGYASLLLNVIVLAGLLFYRFGNWSSATSASPAERAKQLQERQRAEQEAKRRRDNGDISLSENSFVYKVVTAPWWRLGCASVVGIGFTIWAGRRLIRQVKIPDPSEKSAAVAAAQQAHCPKCKADVTQILSSGGSICAACGTQFIFARRIPKRSSSFRESALGELLFDGSTLQRIGALLLVSILVILGLVWCGLMLSGQWIASKNLFAVMFLVAASLGTMVALYARRQN
jgi:hypothetical protein